MAKQINLINAEPKKVLSLQKLKRRAKQVVGGTMVLFIFFAAVILVGYLLLQRDFVAKKKTIQTFENELPSFAKNESYLVTIADRLAAIHPLLEKETSFVKTLSDIEQLFVPGFALSDLEISKEKGIRLNGVCQDLASITNFNEQLEQLKENALYKGALYPEVSRLKEGKYDISLEIKNEK